MVRRIGRSPQFRPDLSDYRVYVEILTDTLNEQAAFKMSMTDAVKIYIERACETVCPDVVVRKKRKAYRTLEF